MLVYLAGSLSPEVLEICAERAPVCVGPIRINGEWALSGSPNFLFTFADRDARKSAKHFCVQPHRRILIDGGAFATWNEEGKHLGEGAEDEHSLEQYIAFCKEIQKLAKCPVTFIALDVIPGKKDEMEASFAETEEASEQGWENYQRMKQAGIPCLATFRQGGYPKWLTRIADDSDYFAIALRERGTSMADKLAWLENVSKHVGPWKKIHGVGVSSKQLMKAFPFFSVDRTDWLRTGKHNPSRMRNGAHRSLDEWKEIAWRDHIPTRELRKMLGYGTFSLADPEGRVGPYWLDTLAMAHELRRQYEVTEFWRRKGVVWGDDVYRGAELLTREPVGRE